MQHPADCGPSATDRPSPSSPPSSSSPGATTPSTPSSSRRHSITLIPRLQSGISSIFNTSRMRNASTTPKPAVVAPTKGSSSSTTSDIPHHSTERPTPPPSTSSSSSHHHQNMSSSSSSNNSPPSSRNAPPTLFNAATTPPANGRTTALVIMDANSSSASQQGQQDWSSGSSSPDRTAEEADDYVGGPPTELVLEKMKNMYVSPADDDSDGGPSSCRGCNGSGGAYDSSFMVDHEGRDGGAAAGAHNSRDGRQRSDTVLRYSSLAPRKQRQLSPIERLPVEILFNIFQKLGSPMEHFNCILVCKKWADCNIELLWHRPYVTKPASLISLVQALERETGLYPYASLIKRLNLNFLSENISDGTMEPLAKCHRLERLTLTNCKSVTDQGLAGIIPNNKNLLTLDLSHLEHITDSSLELVAQNCKRLQGLNIAGCLLVNDDALIEVSRNCTMLKRLKLNDCTLVTDKSVIEFASNCPQLLEIDLQKCHLVTDDAIVALWNKLPHLRELRLAYCENLTDMAFLPLPNRNFEALRILDLTRCARITDQTVFKIVNIAPRLRNLVLAKCAQITDKAVEAITKLGKNLHFLHLGHCTHLTDNAIATLVKFCTRIRYIDLANCAHLTDEAVKSLATLPKLRRIGLVKCQQITDNAILSLLNRNPQSVCALERVHLSYCMHLTINCIHQLLNRCTKLTHLSLTGVEVFCSNPELTQFCRTPPVDFNEVHQRLFCVFSGNGVVRLRNYLNQHRPLPAHEAPLHHRQGLNGLPEFGESTSSGHPRAHGGNGSGYGPPPPPPPPPLPPHLAGGFGGANQGMTNPHGHVTSHAHSSSLPNLINAGFTHTLPPLNSPYYHSQSGTAHHAHQSNYPHQTEYAYTHAPTPAQYQLQQHHYHLSQASQAAQAQMQNVADGMQNQNFGHGHGHQMLHQHQGHLPPGMWHPGQQQMVGQGPGYNPVAQSNNSAAGPANVNSVVGNDGYVTQQTQTMPMQNPQASQAQPANNWANGDVNMDDEEEDESLE